MLSTAYPILEIIGEALPRDPSDKAARVEFKRAIALPETLTDDDILNLPSINFLAQRLFVLQRRGRMLGLLFHIDVFLLQLSCLCPHFIHALDRHCHPLVGRP
jgi:hypothetical protein